MPNTYDMAFRSILSDCSRLVLPVINELFHENYAGDEKITFFPNEQLIAQKDLPDKLRITDSNFAVSGNAKTKRYHLECESSLPRGQMLIRLFEYDAQIALGDRELKKETLTVTFPNTAVIYLRARDDAPDRFEYVFATPGGTVRYDVPIMNVQSYSLDDIFDKRLFFIVPFHIFAFEKRFGELDKDEGALEGLKSEFEDVIARLDVKERQGEIDLFEKQTIIEISQKVIHEISQNYENVQKGLGDIMSVALLDTEVRKIRDMGKADGIAEGRAEGEVRGRAEGIGMVIGLIRSGKVTFDELLQISDLNPAEVERLERLSEGVENNPQ